MNDEVKTSEMEPQRIELRVAIPNTPSALRFGGTQYFVTFAGAAGDRQEAARLLMLSGTPLKLTVEIDTERLEELRQEKEHAEQAKAEANEDKAGRSRAQRPLFI